MMNPIAQTGMARDVDLRALEAKLERQAMKPRVAARPPQRGQLSLPGAHFRAQALVDHHAADGGEQCHVGKPDHQVELVERAQFGKQPDAAGGADDAGAQQHHRERDDRARAGASSECAGERGRRDVAGDGRHRHGRRDADKDEQRRHQEAAADTEHSGDVADREPHREHEKDIHRQVGDGEVNLQALRPRL